MSEEFSRPSVDEVHMEVAHVWRKRSTCTRGSVGSVLVVDGREVASGYNGAPPGAPHCYELGCDVRENEHGPGCQRAMHAEANVIAFAARHGVRTEGATLYCTHGACLKCAHLIVSAGIKEFVYGVPYRLSDGVTFLIESGVTVRRMPTDYIQKLAALHDEELVIFTHEEGVTAYRKGQPGYDD